MHAQTVGVILAGGKSTRMGVAKVTLPYFRRTFLEQAEMILKGAGTDKIVVSGWPKGVPKALGFRVIEDSIENCGPLMGICSVMDAFETGTGFLFVPVDMPTLSSSTLKKLIHESESRAFTDHPLPMFIRSSAHIQSVLKEVLQRERASVKSFHHAVGTFYMHVEDVLKNINTPDDLARA